MIKVPRLFGSQRDGISNGLGSRVSRGCLNGEVFAIFDFRIQSTLVLDLASDNEVARKRFFFVR